MDSEEEEEGNGATETTGNNLVYLKEEMIGHTTMCVLSLLGVSLYSLSYSLVYSGSASSPVVAVLEMWMVTTHLVISLCSLGIQGLAVTLMKIQEPLPFVANAQSSIFLGIAMLTTFLGMSCLNESNEFCQVFFGAAFLPKFSAVGAFAWAWIMYVSSLSCQTWGGGGFSLGISDFGCLCVTGILFLVPLSVVSKVVKTCPNAKTVQQHFCSSMDILCENWLLALVVFMGFIFEIVGNVLTYKTDNNLMVYGGSVVKAFGILFFVIGGMVYIMVLDSTYGFHYVIGIVLCILSALEMFVSKKWFLSILFEKQNKNKKRAYNETGVRMDFGNLMHQL